MARSSERGLRVLGRRELLRLAGLVTVGGLAGCTGGRDGVGSGDGGDGGAYGGGGGAASQDQSPTRAPETDTLAEGVGYGGGSETAATEPEPELEPEAETETTPSGSRTSTPTPTGSPTAAMTETPVSETVTLDGVEFNPVRLEVPTGATVTWHNDDSFGHDVTAAGFHDAADSWDFEASLGPDDTVSHTFDEPGIYEYVCTIHGESTMCGVVLVGGATLDPSLPCENGGESY